MAKIQVALHRLGAARDGGDAGAGDLDQAERLHQGDELVDLDRRAGDLEARNARSMVSITCGAEGVGEAQRLDALLAGAGDLDQRQLALDAGFPARSSR